MTDAPRLVRVIWRDCGLAVNDGWQKRLFYQNMAETYDAEAVTIGYLIVDTEMEVVVAQTWDAANDNFMNGQLILRHSIDLVEDLGPA